MISVHVKQRLLRRRCVARGIAVLYILIVNVLLFLLMYNRRVKIHDDNLTKSSIGRFLQDTRLSRLSAMLAGSDASKARQKTSLPSNPTTNPSAISGDQAAAACDIRASEVFAIVPTAQSASTAGSNGSGKFAPPYDHYIRLLQKILRLSRNLPPNDIYLQIFLDVETVHPAHRLWCRDVSWCHLHLMSNSSDLVAIIQNMHDLRLCATRYVILPDTANIDSAFMLRLHMLPAARVACLVSQASNNLPDMCPSRAFQIPTTFHITQASPQASPHADIVITTAVQQGLYAGAFNIVNMQ